MNWQQLSRFFYVERNFGGLHYAVRGGILELNGVQTIAVKNEIIATRESTLLAEERVIEAQLHVWESEGGAFVYGTMSTP